MEKEELEKEETAVDFILNELKDKFTATIQSLIEDCQHEFEEVFSQAKLKFEKQITKCWENGYEHGACVNEDKDKYHGTQYFQQVFKK